MRFLSMFSHLVKRAPQIKRVRVEVKQGIVVGVENTLENHSKWYSFKGIPYAEPPVGHLRLKPPVALEKFPAPEIDCSKEGNICFHKDMVFYRNIGSEDCLFLNVYTPQLPSSTPSKPLAVMVWIHGGAFIMGSGSSDIYSPEKLLEEDVIVVTMNYRHGPFGFISLPEVDVNGNFGLKDQRLALQWIQQNISQFGGDPNNVTLFGESAGAASTHLHLLSPNSRPFFHKAICQSSTATMEWVIANEPDVKARRLAKMMGCSGTTDKEILEFLINKSTKSKNFMMDVTGLLSKDEQRRGLPMAFKPSIEPDSPDAVVTRRPIDALKVQDSFDIPVMMGYNSDEGIIILLDVLKKMKMYDSDLERLIPRSLNILPNDPECKNIAHQMRKFYFNGEPITKKLLPQYVDLMTDYNFSLGIILAAELHAKYQKSSPLYFYRFSFDGDLNLFKKIFRFDYLKGACHGDEMFYLFNMNILDILVDQSSQTHRVSKNMCKMWTNFAKYGKPTPDNSLQFSWDPVKAALPMEKINLDYLEIGKQSEMMINPDSERMDFWREMFTKYNGSFLNPLL